MPVPVVAPVDGDGDPPDGVAAGDVEAAATVGVDVGSTSGNVIVAVSAQTQL